ncbi:hypothetical protein A0H76_1936 [Hepatospora eriocheir]|uniref:Uncharacterized protein n=1 Tax=Hepatospora eriocheir TaxID=1081669 RepID=A0A1X0QG67_9MICR|nr:hypothetical protein A0H76_1936 [Hepatospora eriocheir]
MKNFLIFEFVSTTYLNYYDVSNNENIGQGYKEFNNFRELPRNDLPKLSEQKLPKRKSVDSELIYRFKLLIIYFSVNLKILIETVSELIYSLGVDNNFNAKFNDLKEIKHSIDKIFVYLIVNRFLKIVCIDGNIMKYKVLQNISQPDFLTYIVLKDFNYSVVNIKLLIYSTIQFFEIFKVFCINKMREFNIDENEIKKLDEICGNMYEKLEKYIN